MAQIQPTDPRAAKEEAAQKRAEAQRLLSEAEDLDPTPAPKEKKEKAPAKVKAKPAKKPVKAKVKKVVVKEEKSEPGTVPAKDADEKGKK